MNSATDWRPLTCDFEVRDEAGNDVEFVLDFNGAEGEAGFDLNTVGAPARAITRDRARFTPAS